MDDQLHRLLGLYMKAPQWIKSSIGWAYAHIPPSVRFGSAYSSYQAAFSKAPTERELQACLRGTLLTGIEHVPAYQALRHLRPLIEQDPLRALQQFPIKDKTDLKGRLDEYTSTLATDSQKLKTFTGGSTSVPIMPWSSLE